MLGANPKKVFNNSEGQLAQAILRKDLAFASASEKKRTVRGPRAVAGMYEEICLHSLNGPCHDHRLRSDSWCSL
jgi:hypothetical protein